MTGARDCEDAMGATRVRPSVGTKTLVCHSMGGIVVRQMLDTKIDTFRNKSVGLVLIASPSYGSRLANNVESLIRFYRHRQAAQLKWGNDSLEELDARFRD